MWCFKWCLVHFCVSLLFAVSGKLLSSKSKHKLLPLESYNNAVKQHNITHNKISKHHSYRRRIKKLEENDLNVNSPSSVSKYNGPVKSHNTTKKPSHKKDKKIKSALVWKKTNLTKAHLLSDEAFVIGEDVDGVPLWAIRAQMEDSDLNIGQFNVNRTFASVPVDGNEVVIHDDFEVLCKNNDNAVDWVKYRINGEWPKNAMLAGEVGISTNMFVGRIKKGGHFIPGKIIKAVLYVPYMGQEYQYDDDFEVLVESQKSNEKSAKIPRPAFTWKKTCVKHAHILRNKAVTSGKDRDGIPLWVIRAQLENEDLTLGNFNPNRTFASVPKGGHDVLVHDYFDVLCKSKKDAVHWMKYKKSDVWPSEAILGGEMENSTKFYVGRIKHDELYISGKVVNKVIYIVHHGHELQYSDNFEVLVVRSDHKKQHVCDDNVKTALFSWKKTCVKHAHKLSDKALVGARDSNGNPLWVIRAQLEGQDLALGTFNPDSSYANVLNDGHEIKHSFHVLCEKNKDALDWIKYKKSDSWPKDAVVAGEMENYTKIYVGRTKHNGLYTPGKIINKVLYTVSEGQEYQCKNKFEVLVGRRSGHVHFKTANAKEERITKETEVVWTRTSLNKAYLLEDQAVVGGKDLKGSPLWVIRAQLDDDDMNLGIFNFKRTYASVPKDGSEVLIHKDFEVLCQKKKNAVEWQNYKKYDPWPEHAVYASEMPNSTKIYVGRVKQDGQYIPGKIINEMLTISYQGLEYKFDDNFEVLVESNGTSKKHSYKESVNINSSETFVTWKNISPKNFDLLINEVIEGGESFGGSPLWIIRSINKNGINVGIFNPNLTYATAAENGAEVMIDHNFDVLCKNHKDAIKWVLHKKADNPMPKFAVLAGQTANLKNVYVGRYNMDGHYTPGKVLDKILYIAYQGLEFRYNETYEILVENRIPTELLPTVLNSKNVTRTTTKKPNHNRNIVSLENSSTEGTDTSDTGPDDKITDDDNDE